MASSSISSARLDDLRASAASFGFDHLSLAEPRIPEPHHSAYKNWVNSGLSAEMAYMARSPEKRLNPDLAYPGVKSILTLAVSYYQGNFPDKPGPDFGRVARYAWGQDYHTVIAHRLENFLAALPGVLGVPVQPRVAVDTQPLLERALSSASGLGFLGKNTVLIVPQNSVGQRSGFHVGSYVFLTEILLDVRVESDIPPSLSGCGSCSKCLTACPTKAFRGPYELDAGKCLAYLTIENKGWIPRAMRAPMQDWIFGCDVCQEVCPFNARAKEAMWPEFQPTNGVGPYLNLREILSCESDAEFKARWGATPISRPKRSGLIRNAAVVAGNLKLESLSPLLEARLSDSNPLVRGHVAWALAQSSAPKKWRPMLERQLAVETDPLVREELKWNLVQ
jgi:epoxyqueuosine reductase